MTLFVGGLEFSTLKGQPLGYEERDVRRGVSIKKWLVTGLLKPSEWLDLLTEYDEWRDGKITESDPTKSLEQGSTIQLVGDGPGGSSWSADCWFSSAPKGEQAGKYIDVSVELVDATQSLEVYSKEIQDETEPGIDYGTVSVGSGSNIATVKLLKGMDGYAEGPSLQLTAAGEYYSTGPLTVRRTRDIEGIVTSADWTKIRNWYEQVIQVAPIKNTWFPTSAPTATARNKRTGTQVDIEYIVSIQLAFII